MKIPKKFNFHQIADIIWLDFKQREKDYDEIRNFNENHINSIFNRLAGNWLFHVTEDYQEWFIINFSKYIPKINNLRNDLKLKYSHLVMGNKFGLL